MRIVSHARKNLSTDCAGLPILATDEVRKPSHFRLTVVFDTARLPPCAVAIESVPFAFGMNEWLKLGRARRGVSVRNWIFSPAIGTLSVEAQSGLICYGQAVLLLAGEEFDDLANDTRLTRRRPSICLAWCSEAA